MTKYNYFNQFSNQWWSESDVFKVLHEMNSTRISFVKNLVSQNFSRKGFKNLSILDVGCGGGIACESFARLGANITGIDISEEAIAVARAHALDQNLSIQYECMDLQNSKKTYDVVTCFEVIEHVDNLETFLAYLIEKIKLGGILAVSTINRTVFSYMVGILGAEYITRKIPVGTHDWDKFIKPDKLIRLVENYGMVPLALKGLNYSVLKKEWYLGGKLEMNYLVGFKKRHSALKETGGLVNEKLLLSLR